MPTPQTIPQVLTKEQLLKWLPLRELSELLRLPMHAVLNVATAKGANASPLEASGFPAPAASLQGLPVWPRQALLVHLSDPARKAAARKLCIERGMVGIALSIRSSHESPALLEGHQR